MRSIALVACGGVLAGLLFTGCRPDSAGSSAPSPDTTTVTAAATHSSRTDPPTEGTESSSPPAGDDARTVAQRLNDASVAARVKQALIRTRSLRRFNFSPTVVRGHLTLRGDVNTREQYRKAARVAANVDGVTGVTNHLTVQGQVVSSDDASEDSDAAYHTVRRGDTLSEIARAYGVSVQQLRALNDLSGPLRPGERIRVR